MTQPDDGHYDDMIVIDALQYDVAERIHFEEWRQAGLTCVHTTCAIWENARETFDQIGTYVTTIDANNDLVILVKQPADIRRAKADGKTGVLLGFQNTAPIENDLNLVGLYADLGIRVVQLTYNIQNAIGCGFWEPTDTGLSQFFGRSLVAELNEHGVLIDISHCGERTSLDAIAASELPVAATHANPRGFVGEAVGLPGRNKSTDVLRALADAGGVIGLCMYAQMTPNDDKFTFGQFCEMIEWTAERFGIEHVGLGTDLGPSRSEAHAAWILKGKWTRHRVGPTGKPSLPDFAEWLSTSTQFPQLVDGLTARGFSTADIAAIMGNNWLRLFESVMQY